MEGYYVPWPEPGCQPIRMPQFRIFDFMVSSMMFLLNLRKARITTRAIKVSSQVSLLLNNPSTLVPKQYIDNYGCEVYKAVLDGRRKPFGCLERAPMPIQSPPDSHLRSQQDLGLPPRISSWLRAIATANISNKEVRDARGIPS